MAMCPICELNYIKDNEEMCEVCKRERRKEETKKDNNKRDVEKYLLPFLRECPQETINKLTQKALSYEAFKLRYPLLVECQNINKEECQKEVAVGASSNYRYYIEPYYINGKYYHICSQLADFSGEESKNLLKIISREYSMLKDK